jgi:hypothetical protein
VHNWPEEWNIEGTLFGAACEAQAAKVKSKVERESVPKVSEGLANNIKGAWAELSVDMKITELGGTYHKPDRDDLPYDRVVYLGTTEGRTVQIKWAAVKNGKAIFHLGPRIGMHNAKADNRRWLSARPRADLFILVTIWREKTRFYVIPSTFLRGRTSLTVRPGSVRLRKGLDPEWYVNGWKHLTSGAGIPTSIFDDPMGTL